MSLPAVRKRPRMMPPKEDAPIDCPQHRAFVRKRECCVMGLLPEPHKACWGPMDCHHSKTRGSGGGDETGVPLCRGHHGLVETPNWSQARVEAEAKVSFAEISAGLWRISDPAKRYLRRIDDRQREQQTQA